MDKEKTIREEFFGKLYKEYRENLGNLKNCEKDIIINSSYETVFKERILDMFDPYT